MRKQEVLQFLEAHKQEMIERFGVMHLALFGSTVRDEAGENSDVDVLVEFEGRETYRNYFDLLFFLEDNLHSPVDLVCSDAVPSAAQARYRAGGAVCRLNANGNCTSTTCSAFAKR